MNEKNLKTIFTTYGYKTQLIKLIEECAELIHAVSKGDEKKIIEEMADVSVVMQGILQNKGWEDEHKEVMEFKINRQIERIENDRIKKNTQTMEKSC